MTVQVANKRTLEKRLLPDRSSSIDRFTESPPLKRGHSATKKGKYILPLSDSYLKDPAERAVHVLDYLNKNEPVYAGRPNEMPAVNLSYFVERELGYKNPQGSPYHPDI